MSNDPLDDHIPELADTLSGDDADNGGFMGKLKGMFKKSGSEDAFGQVAAATDDPFALQEQEDAMFAKRRKIMGFVLVGGVIALIGLGAAALMIDWGSDEALHPQQAGQADHGAVQQQTAKHDTAAHDTPEHGTPEHGSTDGHAAPAHATKDQHTPTYGSHGDSGPKVSQSMPVVSGPEDLQKALIRPPGVQMPHNPDMDRRKRSLVAMTPEQLAAQQAAEAESHAPAPHAAEHKAPDHKAPEHKAPAHKAPEHQDPAAQPAAKSVATAPATPLIIPALPAPRSNFKHRAEPPQLAALPKLPAGHKPKFQKAPQKDLQQRNPAGKILPTVSPDGRRPWKAYAQAYSAQKGHPQISVVLQNVGLSKTLTTAAVLRMPPEVALAFSPYAAKLSRQLAEARKHGHETLLTIGLESSAFPLEDPGPDGLFTALSIGENTKRLEQSLSNGTVYLGVVAQGGDRFVASEKHFASLLENLKKMGLLYVAPDRKVAPFQIAPQKPARTVADIHIRQNTFRDQVEAYLRATEDIARQSGRAVLLVDATPLAMSALSTWFPSLAKRGFQLAPISSQVKQ